jgi:nitrite reductase/ring-hydroxylating ferredoxin subunit/uncharacterized membrane protein
MRSRAIVYGHPLHPMLVPFPFAFLTGALLFDVLGWALARPSFWQTGSYLAILGVATGLLAAVPGIIDFLKVVPPQSTGRTRAFKHLLANASALVLFAVAWVVRGELPERGIGTVGLELVGAALLSAGAWMGGTLVYRNQIAIDHRYAHAGKWREIDLAPASGSVTVASTNELQPNQMKLVHVGDRRIVLARTEGGFAAFDDRCPHRGGSLAGGATMCGVVQCPWHGSQFDVRSGQVKAGPAKESIATYAVTVEGGDVMIRV